MLSLQLSLLGSSFADPRHCISTGWKQLCSKRLGSPTGHQAEHEPAMCPCHNGILGCTGQSTARRLREVRTVWIIRAILMSVLMDEYVLKRHQKFRWFLSSLLKSLPSATNHAFLHSPCSAWISLAEICYPVYHVYIEHITYVFSLTALHIF